MQAFANNVIFTGSFLIGSKQKIAVPKADAQGATTESEPHTRGFAGYVCADRLPRTEFSFCKNPSPQRSRSLAKLPEEPCRKPYFHFYHIIPYIKKEVKAFEGENLDYLYDHFGKRIV